MKPRVFVGSSSENLKLAYAVQENLERDADITVWTQGVFSLSRSNLEALSEALPRFKAGIFILAPDDLAVVRDQTSLLARDNVVFELGLFIGALGRECTFIVLPRGVADFRLPSDLLGIGGADYDPTRSDGNWLAALGPACNKIRKALVQCGLGGVS